MRKREESFLRGFDVQKIGTLFFVEPISALPQLSGLGALASRSDWESNFRVAATVTSRSVSLALRFGVMYASIALETRMVSLCCSFRSRMQWHR